MNRECSAVQSQGYALCKRAVDRSVPRRINSKLGMAYVRIPLGWVLLLDA